MARSVSGQFYEDRRDEIVNAAERCMLHKGLHNLTLRDIAQEHGRSLGNIYNYFGSKEEIVEVLVQRLIERFIKSATADIDPNLRSKLTPDECIRYRVEKLVDAYMDVETARVAISVFAESFTNPKIKEVVVASNKRLREHLMSMFRRDHELSAEDEEILRAELTVARTMVESLRVVILFNPEVDKEHLRSVVIDSCSQIFIRGRNRVQSRMS